MAESNQTRHGFKGRRDMDMAVSNQTRAHLCHDRLVGCDTAPQIHRNYWVVIDKMHDAFFDDPAQKLPISE